jgi:hypothetical protein
MISEYHASLVMGKRAGLTPSPPSKIKPLGRWLSKLSGPDSGGRGSQDHRQRQVPEGILFMPEIVRGWLAAPHGSMSHGHDRPDPR